MITVPDPSEIAEVEQTHWRPNVIPREKRRPSQWAEEERWIAAGQSPLSKGRNIRYSHEIAPHAIQPMDDADDPRVNIIVLWMGRRMVKTEGICGNVIGRTITDDPGNVYCMGPTDDSSYRYSRDFINPMIEATPCLREIVTEKKSRDTGRTLDYIRYLGGSIYMVNAGSPGKMRGMAARVVIIYEADAFPAATRNEGDPIMKALGRAEGFGDAIKFIESTGTLAPTFDEDGKKEYRSNIHRWYERGDMLKYFCPCRRCDHLQVLRKVDAPNVCEIANLWAPEGKLERAVYLCEKCEADHNEAQWRSMIHDARWLRVEESAPWSPSKNQKLDHIIRGYWISQFCSLLPTGKGFKTKLHQFIAEAQTVAAGPAEERKVWINEVACDLWDPEGDSEPPPDWRKVYERREKY